MRFDFRKLDISYTGEIMKVQDETFKGLPDSNLLRRNSREMIESCLKEPNITIGAFCNDELAGFGVLYFPNEKSEELAYLIESMDTANLKSANFKLCIVREKYRGNSLQYELGMIIENEALKHGCQIICATVSPKNIYSRNNMLRLGYKYDRTLEKYGLERDLFFKML